MVFHCFCQEKTIELTWIGGGCSLVGGATGTSTWTGAMVWVAGGDWGGGDWEGGE